MVGPVCPHPRARARRAVAHLAAGLVQLNAEGRAGARRGRVAPSADGLPSRCAPARCGRTDLRRPIGPRGLSAGVRRRGERTSAMRRRVRRGGHAARPLRLRCASRRAPCLVPQKGGPGGCVVAHAWVLLGSCWVWMSTLWCLWHIVPRYTQRPLTNAFRVSRSMQRRSAGRSMKLNGKSGNEDSGSENACMDQAGGWMWRH